MLDQTRTSAERDYNARCAKHGRTAEASYAFGQACGQVIELTLCGVEQHAPSTPAFELCCIAEAIIEHMAGRPEDTSWDDVTAGVRAVSARFRKAELAA